MLYTQVFLFFQNFTPKEYFGELEIVRATIVFISKQKYENNSVHCCRNIHKITIETATHYNGGPWLKYNLTSVSVNNSSNSLNSFSTDTISDKNS